MAVNTANTPEVIRAIRNAMTLAKVADSIDPEVATTISAKEATKSRSYK